MVKSRFLGKPPRTRCRRTLVQVGVSDFVDNEAKTARLISIALNVFRTTFEKDGEVCIVFVVCTYAVCGYASDQWRVVVAKYVWLYPLQKKKKNNRVVFIIPVYDEKDCDNMMIFPSVFSNRISKGLAVTMARPPKTWLSMKQME